MKIEGLAKRFAQRIKELMEKQSRCPGCTATKRREVEMYGRDLPGRTLCPDHVRIFEKMAK